MSRYQIAVGGILLSLCHVLLKTESTITCKRNEYKLDDTTCCTQCKPGQGVQQQCTTQNNTKCQSCIFGESYSSVYSHTEDCQYCTVCPEYSHSVEPCDLTHDTSCKCDRNYYQDQTLKKCRPCKFCPIEYGVHKECGETNDRTCMRCPEGYYSDRLGTQPCMRCGTCGMNQVMLQHCSPGQNTICIDIPTMRSTPWPQDGFTESSAIPNKANTQTNLIPVYCSLLGALIVALVVYVIIKQNRQRQLAKSSKAQAALAVTNECPPLLSGPSSMVGGVQCKHGSDSGVYVEQDRQLTNNTRIRDIPPLKRKALENSMHGCPDDQGGWRTLARELGFSGPMVLSIETRAHQDGTSPVRILLSEWGKRDNALVGTLLQALRVIHREDCIRLLCGDTREYVPAPNYVDLNSMHSQMV